MYTLDELEQLITDYPNDFIHILWLYEEYSTQYCLSIMNASIHEYTAEFIELQDAVIMMINTDDGFSGYIRIFFKDIMLELSGQESFDFEHAWIDGSCFYEVR